MKKLISLLCLLPVVVAGCGGHLTSPVGATAAGVTASPHMPGPLGDTWMREDGRWHEHAIAGPSARYLSSITYDAAHHVYVLFGGWTAKGASDETWTFDGVTWTLRNPVHRPDARRGAAMAFDPVRAAVVLYGGLVADSAEGYASNDTWIWDGADWTVGTPDATPGHREGARMATTPDGVVLYGGRTDNTNYFGDAWIWNGRTWTLLAKEEASGPPARASAAIAWDVKDQGLFVFGGIGINSAGGPGAQGTSLADAWLLTRKGWLSAKDGPPATTFSGGVWSAADDRIEVIFGMVCPNPVNDAWGWDRSTGWSRNGTSPVPARWGSALAADTNGNLLAFGGDDERGC